MASTKIQFRSEGLHDKENVHAQNMDEQISNDISIPSQMWAHKNRMVIMNIALNIVLLQIEIQAQSALD